MKKQIVIGLSTALLALPALALAETSVGLGANANANADLRVGDLDADGDLEVKVDGKANAEEKSGKPIPTLYGARAEEHGTTSAGWSDNKGKGNDDADQDDDSDQDESGSDEKGWGKGGIVGFFRAMFGLDDSSKMGDIKDAMDAKAASGTEVSSSNGLGFWARIWGLFSFGGKSDSEANAD